MCFYQNLVIVTEYHVDCSQTLCDVCCKEFPVPQIDCKSKQVKEQLGLHRKFYLQSVWEKLAILNTENIKICG